MLEHARAYMPPDPRNRVRVGNGYNLAPLEDASVDFVFANDVFIHRADIHLARTYVSEANRVLRPRGIFRFNTRRLEVGRAFGRTPGGTLARAPFGLGIWSQTHKRWPAGGPNAFDGIAYTARYLRRHLLSGVTWDAQEIVSRDNRFWCTLTR